MLSNCQVQKNEAHIVPGPPQTDRKNIWICKNCRKCYFFSMKKGAKIETQSAGGGGAKPIVF